jgi:hypothetical protein
MSTRAQWFPGGCLCSAIRYRVAGAPLHSAVCHCRTCRKAAGSPVVAWVTFERENFEWLSGTPRELRSSPAVRRTFCAACGTPLTYENEKDPRTLDVTTVSLDDPALFPPTREVWLEHRIGWQPSNESLNRYPRGSE